MDRYTRNILAGTLWHVLLVLGGCVGERDAMAGRRGMGGTTAPAQQVLVIRATASKDGQNYGRVWEIALAADGEAVLKKFKGPGGTLRSESRTHLDRYFIEMVQRDDDAGQINYAPMKPVVTIPADSMWTNGGFAVELITTKVWYDARQQAAATR